MSWFRTALLALIVSGCGGNVSAIDAAPADAPPAPDAGPGPVDAAPDAAPPARGMDLTSAGGHMSGGTYTLDVQVGHATDQGKATGGTFTLEGGAAVKP